MCSPPGVVRMERNLAVVDYVRNAETSEKIIQSCPTGAIVWLTARRGAVKGRDAKPVVRHSALPIG